MAKKQHTTEDRLRGELREKERLLREAQDLLRKYTSSLERGSKALIETELRYHELFDRANDAIFTVSSRNEQILDVNRQAQVLTGYSRTELLKMTLRDLHPPEQRSRIKDFAQQVTLSGEGVIEDDYFVTKDGNRIIVNISYSTMTIHDAEVVNLLCRDVTRIRSIEAELNNYTRQLEVRCEENTQQLLESQAQLVQAEKMAALGSLLAGVAHEIRTPLGSIHGNNDIFNLAFDKIRTFIDRGPLGTDAPECEDLREVLSITSDAIRTNRMACERMVNIVRSLRTFVRLDESERILADLHEGLESTLILVAHELKRRIKVVKEYGSIPKISCYPNQLNQVFMNLLVNASQAIEGEGVIRIRTWADETHVYVSISDTGKGIAPENHKKIFEPGFTTKKVGVGTGLGLSICARILKDHGGRIDLQSRPGQGATFTLILPIRSQDPERKSNDA